jgi:hypothetical protein
VLFYEEIFVKGWQYVLALAFLAFSNQVFACDVMLPAGANLHSAVSAYAGKDICLSTGTYDLGSTTLTVPSGTQLIGQGSTREAVAIRSHALRAITVGSNVTLKNFLLDGYSGASNEYGILVYQKSNVVIWNLLVQNFLINIGVSGSSTIDIWGTRLRYNGDTANGKADPNLWISASTDVTVLYGQATGRANGPGGDGEVAAHNSSHVVFDGLYSFDSGASAIYYVNCDDCKIANTVIDRAGEWGLDVVQGSDRVIVDGNEISWSNFGGSVFDEAGSVGGAFTNNSFNVNRQMGVGACNGINVIGNVASVAQSGNVSSPAGTICDYQ